jgi:hypothetical protein
MAKHHRQNRTWEQPLSIEDFLAATTLASSLFDKEFEGVTLLAEATLTDLEVKATTIDELREDLREVSDGEVGYLELCVTASGAETILTSDPRNTASHTGRGTTLRTSGSDATRVIGLHGQLEGAITRRLDQLDTKASIPIDPQIAGITIGSIGGSVGSISGGAVAPSGGGDQDGVVVITAEASSGSSATKRPPEQRESRWWNSRWLVAIVGGTAAILIATGVLALLHLI